MEQQTCQVRDSQEVEIKQQFLPNVSLIATHMKGIIVGRKRMVHNVLEHPVGKCHKKGITNYAPQRKTTMIKPIGPS